MTRLRDNWLPLTAVLAALLGALYVTVRLISPMPREVGPTYYWLVLAYNYTALPVAALVLLAAMTVAFFWFPQFLVRGPTWKRDGVLVAVAALAAVGGVWSAFPLGSVIYRELESASVGDRRYHLGLRLGSPGSPDNVCILCACDRVSFACQCRFIHDESLANLEAVPRLVVDSAMNKVVVEIDGRTVYEEQK